jgi:pyruvate,water dikinase
VGASPGVASGRVRVIESPDDMASFVSGEVLVTPTPNPAWTPMYALASALVTSTGGILSHGLVSAREYHLPAVIGIADATRKLANGQHIVVDGDRGTVSIDA